MVRYNFEDVMAKTFPNLVKIVNSQVSNFRIYFKGVAKWISG